MNFSSRGIPTASLATFLMLSMSGSPQAAENSQRFKDECSECHGDASEFALDWLGFSNGKLVATGVEKPVAEFLEKHRELTPRDIEYYVDFLTRVAKDAGLK